ncbi:ATPase involved in DNA repair/chromosome segregation [Giardia duodenalis]|uniref:ATPase involved in DNA repair/chromosome segregation n=1 Tax=Giardia intestinalis TaxID=5741 RepID=V6U3K5_GIAIN|nr:ATPase involved in DNA repair/chromosome segregation [Giardia intestinalis]
MNKSRCCSSLGRNASLKIIAMVWTPTPTAVASTEKLINLASCMTNEANKEANDLMAKLVEAEADLPCLLLEAFLSDGPYSMYAGALFRSCICQSYNYIVSQGRQDIMSHLFLRLADGLQSSSPRTYNSQSILASMISALVCHERVGYIWPDLERILTEAVVSMQTTYVLVLTTKQFKPESLNSFTCVSLLIQNITDDSVKVLKGCKGLSDAIEKMILAVLASITTFAVSTAPADIDPLMLAAFTPVLRLYKGVLTEPISPSFSDDTVLISQVFTLIERVCPAAIHEDWDLLQAALDVVARSINITPELYYQNESFFSNVLELMINITKELYQLEGIGRESEAQTQYVGVKLRGEGTAVARLVMEIWHLLVSDSKFYPVLRNHITHQLIDPLLTACILQEDELLFLQSSTAMATRDVGQISDLLGPWTNRKHALLLLDMLCGIRRDCTELVVQGCTRMLSSCDISIIEGAITILAYVSSHVKGETINTILMQIKATVLDAFYADYPEPLLFDQSTGKVSFNEQFSTAMEVSYRSFNVTESHSQLLGAPATGERVPLFLSAIVSHSVYTISKYIEAFESLSITHILASFLKVLVFSADIRTRYYVIGAIGTIVDIAIVSSDDCALAVSQCTLSAECNTEFCIDRIAYEAVLNIVCGLLLLDVRANRVIPSELNFLVDVVISCLMADSGKEATTVIAGVAEYDMSGIKQSRFCTSSVVEALAEVFSTLLPSYLPHVIRAVTTLSNANDSDERICLAFSNLNDAISSLLGDLIQPNSGPQTEKLQETIYSHLIPTYIDSIIKGFMLCLDQVENSILWPDLSLLESLISFINDALLTGSNVATMILNYNTQSLVPAIIQTVSVFVGTTLQAEMLGILGEITREYPAYIFAHREYPCALLDCLFDIIQSSFEPKAQNNAVWLFGTLIASSQLIESIGLHAYTSLYCSTTSGELGPYLTVLPLCCEPPKGVLAHSDTTVLSSERFHNYAQLLLELVQEERATSDVLINAAIALLKWTRSYLLIGRAIPFLDCRLLQMIAENLDTLALQVCKSDDIDDRDSCFIAILMVAICMPDVAAGASAEVCCALVETMKMCPIDNEEFDALLNEVLQANIIVGLSRDTLNKCINS